MNRFVKKTNLPAVSTVVSLICCIASLINNHLAEPTTSPLGFLIEFNQVYWIGLFFLVVSTILWYRSFGTFLFGLLLLELWVSYLFLIPIAGQPLASSRDTWEHLYLVDLLSPSNTSALNPFYEVGISPGFYIFEKLSEIITGIDYTNYPKVFLDYVMYYVASIIFVFFGKITISQPRNQILFGLTAISFLWVPLLSMPSPEFFGLLLYVPAVGLMLSRMESSMKEALFFIVVIAAVVFSHILLSFILIGQTLLVWAFNSYKKVPSKSLVKDFHRFIITTSIFVAHYSLFPSLLYVAFQSFKQGLLNPLGSSPVYLAQTSYQAESINISFLFALILIVWLFTGLLLDRGRSFRSEVTQKLLLLMLPLLLIPFTGVFSNESILRIFFLGIPLEGVFLVTLTSRNKYVGLVFVILLLTLSIPVRYSHQYVEYVPNGELVGSAYLSSHISSNIVTLWPRAKPGAAGSLVNSTSLSNALQIVPYARSEVNMIEGVNLAVESPLDKNLILWFDGPTVFELIANTYYSSHNDLIYTTNDFSVYYISPPASLRI